MIGQKRASIFTIHPNSPLVRRACCKCSSCSPCGEYILSMTCSRSADLIMTEGDKRSDCQRQSLLANNEPLPSYGCDKFGIFVPKGFGEEPPFAGDGALGRAVRGDILKVVVVLGVFGEAELAIEALMA